MQRLELAPHEPLPLEPQVVPPLARGGGGGGHLGEVVGHHDAEVYEVEALLARPHRRHHHRLRHFIPIIRRGETHPEPLLPSRSLCPFHLIQGATSVHE